MKIFKNKHKLVIKTSAMSDICLSRTLNMVGAPGLDQILGEAEDTNVNKKFVSRAKSLSFLTEAQPRLENRREQKALFDIKFFRRPQELQSKRHHWKNSIFLSAC
jgi:hypothetical protein